MIVEAEFDGHRAGTFALTADQALDLAMQIIGTVMRLRDREMKGARQGQARALEIPIDALSRTLI